MTAEMIGLFGLLGLGGIIVLCQYVETVYKDHGDHEHIK